MDIVTILQISTYVLGFVLVVFIPVVIKLINKCKKLAKTTDENEQGVILMEMYQTLKGLVESAEVTYNQFSSALSGGIKTGNLKKTMVMTQLQSYALSKGYEYDQKYWEDQLESLIDFSKLVNKSE